MERSYITAGFFRYTMYRRFEASQSQAAVQKALNKGKTKKGFMGFGGGGAAEPDAAGQPGPGAITPASSMRSSDPATGISMSSLADPNDYIAAHFDKKVNEESTRQSLPVDGWRWQKRFFIFSGQYRPPPSFQDLTASLGSFLCGTCVITAGIGTYLLILHRFNPDWKPCRDQAGSTAATDRCSCYGLPLQTPTKPCITSRHQMMCQSPTACVGRSTWWTAS